MKIKTFNLIGMTSVFAFAATTLTLQPANAQVTAPTCTKGAEFFIGTNLTRGDTLRTFKLALATTGELTQHLGGITATKAVLNQRIKELNDVFGPELAVNFELMPGNDTLVFPDPNTDPWPDGTNMLAVGGMWHAPVDNALGVDAASRPYDFVLVLGHPWGGGAAGSNFAVVASANVTSQVMRHELGHFLGQAHTNEYAPKQDQCYAVELPGRSRNETIGTVNGPNTTPKFHSVSFHQTASRLAPGGRLADKGRKTLTGNNIPTVNAGSDYTIPHSTAFTLTGTASDSDTGDQLTYVWDQMDVGGTRPFPPFAGTMDGPLFSRLEPTPSPSRTFPRSADLVANRYSSNQEVIPTAARVLNFRLMVNDNHKFNNNLVSGINSDDVKITVANTGPFAVTSPNTAVTYPPGSITTVTWNVNGTNGAPINTQVVKISLSSDDGLTFPDVLAASVSNTGSASVALPNKTVDRARIKVEAVGNIFFDISNQDFVIGAVATRTGTRITPPNGRYRIRSMGNQRTLHNSGEMVSTISQTTDNFSLFEFERMADGSYEIFAVGNNLASLHVRGASGGDRLLSTRPTLDDDSDFTEFFIEEDPDKTIRFVIKGSGRYLRLQGQQGGDQLVSTRVQDNTNWTRFYLEPVSTDTGTPEPICEPDEILVNGVCQFAGTEEPACEPDEVLVDGECQFADEEEL